MVLMNHQLSRSQNLGAQLAQKTQGSPEITRLIRGVLSFDRQSAGVSEGVEPSQERLHVDVAFTEWTILVPGLTPISFVTGILAVDAPNVGPEKIHRLQGIACAVQDHVGRIEVDGEIGSVNGLYEGQQLSCRFLPGFQVEALVVARASIAAPPFPAPVAAACGKTCFPKLST